MLDRVLWIIQVNACFENEIMYGGQVYDSALEVSTTSSSNVHYSISLRKAVAWALKSTFEKCVRGQRCKRKIEYFLNWGKRPKWTLLYIFWSRMGFSVYTAGWKRIRTCGLSVQWYIGDWLFMAWVYITVFTIRLYAYRMWPTIWAELWFVF